MGTDDDAITYMIQARVRVGFKPELFNSIKPNHLMELTFSHCFCFSIFLDGLNTLNKLKIAS